VYVKERERVAPPQYYEEDTHLPGPILVCVCERERMNGVVG